MKLLIFYYFYFFFLLFLMNYKSSRYDNYFQLNIFSLLFLINIIQSFVFDYFFNFYYIIFYQNIFFYLNLVFFSLNVVLEYLYPNFVLYFVSQVILNVVNISFIRHHYETNLRESIPLV